MWQTNGRTRYAVNIRCGSPFEIGKEKVGTDVGSYKFNPQGRV